MEKERQSDQRYGMKRVRADAHIDELICFHAVWTYTDSRRLFGQMLGLPFQRCRDVGGFPFDCRSNHPQDLLRRLKESYVLKAALDLGPFGTRQQVQVSPVLLE